MARIVTSTYRYKRPSRKRKPVVALEGPRVVTIRDKKRVVANPSDDPTGSPVRRSDEATARALVDAARIVNINAGILNTHAFSNHDYAVIGYRS